MKRHFAAVAGMIFGATMFCSMPAFAHGGVQWSVTVDSPGYYAPPPVVSWQEPQFIYGAPPSAFAPPPAVIYVQPQPVYRVYPPPVYYYDQYGRAYEQRHEHRHHDHRWQDEPGRFRR